MCFLLLMSHSVLTDDGRPGIWSRVVLCMLLCVCIGESQTAICGGSSFVEVRVSPCVLTHCHSGESESVGLHDGIKLFLALFALSYFFGLCDYPNIYGSK